MMPNVEHLSKIPSAKSLQSLIRTKSIAVSLPTELVARPSSNPNCGLRASIDLPYKIDLIKEDLAFLGV